MMAQQDPLAEFRIGSRQQSQPIQQDIPEQPQQNQEDPLSDFRIKKVEQGPSRLYETGRHATRVASRIAETIGGIPGDISSLIQSGVITGLEKLTGHKASPEALEEIKGQRLPTSQELKKLSIEKTKGFTEPKDEYERFGDELAETAASLIGPMKFRKALGVAVGAQAAKEGTKILGIGEGKQEAAKLGTMFFLSMINPGGAMKYAHSQFKKAESLSRGASINAVPFEGKLSSLIDDLSKGVSTPSKNAVIKPAQELIGKINKGKISVHDLIAAKRDINSLMKDPELLTGAKKLLKNLGGEVDKAIKPYEKVNPAFSNAYRPANEIHGAIMEGNKASNFISKTLGTKSVVGTVIGEIALGHPEYIPQTLAGAAGLFGAAKSVDFLTRVAKSPELQKYYAKAISAALAEDAPALRLYSDKLEKSLEKR